MNPSLPLTRAMLGRLRVGIALVILVLMVSGIPRWHIHSHADAQLSESHPSDHHSQERANSTPTDDGQAANSLHVHDVVTPFVAFVGSGFTGLACAPSAQAPVSAPPDQLSNAASPPPQRPPIA